MLIDELSRAPIVENCNMNGLLSNGLPGRVLAQFAELRRRVGVIEAKLKPGMKFKTRSNNDLIDEVRPAANDIGLLIYPTEATGTGFVVEDGTLATVQLRIVVQSIEDGSLLVIGGFGLGADSQDKAGGKAGTYAFKAALLQALLAAGTDDTDDEDEPIRGGVRKRSGKPTTPDLETVRSLLEKATTDTEYRNIRELLKRMNPDDILAVRDIAKAAKERCNVTD